MIVIIDYGIGNLRSVEKAFQAVGADVIRSDRPEDLARAEKLVLPGVGAFGACAAELRRRELEAPILEAVAQGKPLLGVCVGMQLLFEEGEEMGLHRGLGLLAGRVVRFGSGSSYAATGVNLRSFGEAAGTDAACERGELVAEPVHTVLGEPLKVPHMGWNTVHARYRHPLLQGIPDGAFFYFVHSYYAEAANPATVLATAQYGIDFPAIVHRNNVYGAQFHPEKSQQNGLRILENFAKL